MLDISSKMDELLSKSDYFSPVTRRYWTGQLGWRCLKLVISFCSSHVPNYSFLEDSLDVHRSCQIFVAFIGDICCNLNISTANICS